MIFYFLSILLIWFSILLKMRYLDNKISLNQSSSIVRYFYWIFSIVISSSSYSENDSSFFHYPIFYLLLIFSLFANHFDLNCFSNLSKSGSIHNLLYFLKIPLSKFCCWSSVKIMLNIFEFSSFFTLIFYEKSKSIAVSFTSRTSWKLD